MKKLFLLIGFGLLQLVAQAQTNITIHVGGDTDKYYPVTFSDTQWDFHEATELTIGRSNTHADYAWAGTAIASFRYHTTNYGHGANFIDAVLYTTADFFGGWTDATGNNSTAKIIIWLKGGGLTYNITSSSTITTAVYDGVQNALPYLELNGPARNYMTVAESYVLHNSHILSNNQLVKGNAIVMNKLGVGTSLPTAKLAVRDEVNGGNVSIGSDANLAASIGFSPGVGFDYWKITANNAAQSYRFDITAGGASYLSIKNNNGNVGIGTITPSEKLSVAGNILADKLLLDENGVRLWGFSPVGGNMILHSGDGSGNVGIGTTSPAAKLEVNGGMILNGPAGSTLTLKKSSTNVPALTFQGATIATVIEAGDSGMKTYIGGVKTTLLPNGNFGVGTETPAEKLSVNGKIRAHEIKVEAANWPDYVFNDNYKPSSLAELESYIKLNRHLPEMPSAKEVTENGVELGEMNKLLLKKIEELTLHLINKEKELSSVIQNVKELNNRLLKLEGKRK